MSVVALNQRFLETTRGQILTLIRRGRQTVEELAAALDLTDNAVRNHLATLERDSLIQQAGVRRTSGAGKPALLYRAPSGRRGPFLARLPVGADDGRRVGRQGLPAGSDRRTASRYRATTRAAGGRSCDGLARESGAHRGRGVDRARRRRDVTRARRVRCEFADQAVRCRQRCRSSPGSAARSRRSSPKSRARTRGRAAITANVRGAASRSTTNRRRRSRTQPRSAARNQGCLH